MQKSVEEVDRRIDAVIEAEKEFASDLRKVLIDMIDLQEYEQCFFLKRIPVPEHARRIRNIAARLGLVQLERGANLEDVGERLRAVRNELRERIGTT